MKYVGILGAAHIHTPSFLDRLNANPDVSATLVWDHDPARASATAEKLGAGIASTPEEVLADGRISAVVICSETDRHEKLATAAAEAGKHLFVEKPLGFAGADALRVAHAIEKAGVLFQTGYFSRGNPNVLQIREWIAQGTLGTITRARHSNCHRGSLKGWFDTQWRWMADPAQAGCGAFGDLGTHSLDLLMWLLGPVASATGTIRAWTGRYGDCDESGEAMLRFESGVVGTIAAGWVDLANPVTLQVSGTAGHAIVMQDKLYLLSETLEGGDGTTPWPVEIQAWPHAFDLFLQALVSKNIAPLVTPAEAAARSVVMEAIYQGARERAWVDIAKA